MQVTCLFSIFNRWQNWDSSYLLQFTKSGKLGFNIWMITFHDLLFHYHYDIPPSWTRKSTPLEQCEMGWCALMSVQTSLIKNKISMEYSYCIFLLSFKKKKNKLFELLLEKPRCEDEIILYNFSKHIIFTEKSC